MWHTVFQNQRTIVSILIEIFIPGVFFYLFFLYQCYYYIYIYTSCCGGAAVALPQILLLQCLRNTQLCLLLWIYSNSRTVLLYLQSVTFSAGCHNDGALLSVILLIVWRYSTKHRCVAYWNLIQSVYVLLYIYKYYVGSVALWNCFVASCCDLNYSI